MKIDMRKLNFKKRLAKEVFENISHPLLRLAWAVEDKPEVLALVRPQEIPLLRMLPKSSFAP